MKLWIAKMAFEIKFFEFAFKSRQEIAIIAPVNVISLN